MTSVWQYLDRPSISLCHSVYQNKQGAMCSMYYYSVSSHVNNMTPS